ncbi:unnamed protein product [Clavelina lepadiformis]|uniref:Uncharacterized protein n=1 Tax=Clavelina lepadiformis TaxID=159417 RepID=A0ABP0FE31_CLALP
MDNQHTELTDKTSHHLNSTSTGRGHYYSKGYYFPPSSFRRTIYDELPPVLTTQDQVIPEDQLINQFHTTTGTVHDSKCIGGVLSNSCYQKAPGSWKVHYVKDNREKLKVKESRNPLTMGVQSSEMKAKYTLNEGCQFKDKIKAGLQPFVLSQHHKKGPSQKVLASTQNEAFPSKSFFIRDKGCLNLNDIYQSSSQRAYRSYKKEELFGCSKNDVPTYWECEEYPKAWGYGSKENPLPKNSIRRDPLPMIDSTWFSTKSKIPRIPKSMEPVPHQGLTTLMRDSFTSPSDVKVKEIFSCPVDTPWVIARPGKKEAISVPHMYRTEYTMYGSDRPVTVT